MLVEKELKLFKDIPMRIIKISAHVYFQRLANIFSNCIKNGKFQDILKYAAITPNFLKKEIQLINVITDL